MKNYILWLMLSFMVISCREKLNQEKIRGDANSANKFLLYSKTVSDTFSIAVSLPNGYNKRHSKKYPVVYLLDANLYFDIIETTLRKYSDVGLAPSVILVGIGYKNFQAMDSLRNRDDTYPVAIPEYEMSVSGGAGKFLSFIDKELHPEIDREFRTDTSNRILMGHSLGGYFTTFAFYQTLKNNSSTFKGYIAASPSIHYNNYWLLRQLKQNSSLRISKKKLKVYITYGGLEEDESHHDSSILKLTNLTNQISKVLAKKQSGMIDHKVEIFSNLNHMDTQIPSFIKGLQWALTGKDQ